MKDSNGSDLIFCDLVELIIPPNCYNDYGHYSWMVTSFNSDTNEMTLFNPGTNELIKRFSGGVVKVGRMIKDMTN